LVTSHQVTKDLLGKRGKRKGGKSVLNGASTNGVEDGEPTAGPNEILLPEKRTSDAPVVKKRLWKNRQRVLLFGSRGIPFRGRHLMENLRRLLPHTKKDSKMDKRDTLFAVNEIADMKNCNERLLFEGRKQLDIYMWVANVGTGPSAKFLVENMSTMEELKFTGNCLKGSRAILSFDPTFESLPHWQLLRELFTQVFGTPYHHPKSQPFIDHVITFSVLDNRIWFRNFQIMEEDGSVVEIGPRFTLNPIRIFDGSFIGQTIWKNPSYVPPNKYRAELKKAAAGKYMDRVTHKEEYERTRPKSTHAEDPSTEFLYADEESLQN